MARKQVQPAATDKYPYKWSALPMSYLVLTNLHVRANRSVMGHLTKGEVYRLHIITEKGLIKLFGKDERLFPMGFFNAPLAAIGETGIDPEQPANDN